MSRGRILWLLTASLGVGWGVPATAQDAPRPAETILREIDVLKPPQLDREAAKDPEAVRAYSQAYREYREARPRLVGEFLKAYPGHDRAEGLWIERFDDPQVLASGKEALADRLKEAEELLAKSPGEKLQISALHFRARASLASRDSDRDASRRAVDAFLAAAPTDTRGATLLATLARNEADPARRAEVEERILKDFAGSFPARSIVGERKREAALGQPFALEFTDAISGESVSVQALKGKVVVIDFWATWCGPCVAELPKLKKLYADYHDKGLEIVGVSLDRREEDGGLKALKEFVAKNEIGWRHYYQGDYWQSEFSSSWGINSIPAVFVVDTEGKLASVNARGKLEEIVPRLLEAKSATTTTSAR